MTLIELKRELIKKGNAYLEGAGFKDFIYISDTSKRDCAYITNKAEWQNTIYNEIGKSSALSCQISKNTSIIEIKEVKSFTKSSKHKLHEVAAFTLEEEWRIFKRNIDVVIYGENDRNLQKFLDIKFPNRFGNLITEEVTSPEELYEGAKQTIQVNAYERNKEAREECLKHYGYNCMVCNFNFEDNYGSTGKNFIHVHHIVPLSEIGREYQVIPIEDLIPVCPNCHAMLHRKIPAYTVNELKAILEANR